MTVSLKHTFQSAKPDGSDSSLVQPSNWNAEHTLTMATDKLLGRATASTGAAEEIGIGTALSLSGGTLAVTNVPVANGGTGLSTVTANNVILGNGTSAFQTVAPGTSGNVLTSNGTTWVAQPAVNATGNLLRITVFTSSGTWTKGTSTNYVYAYGVGGAGSGYVTDANSYFAGGSGAFCAEYIDVSAVSSVSVTVGAAGTTSAWYTNGSAGGNTSFGSYWTAGGGAGATSSGAASGGTATGGGLLNINGGRSQTGGGLGYGVPTAFGPYPAYGASSPGYNGTSSSDVAGATGAAGVVVVLEYS